MYSFFYKKCNSTEASSDKYISVNNYGYYEDISTINVIREQGRVDYQLIYIKSGAMLVGNEKILLGKGNICLFRPKETQIYRNADVPTTYFWIHFSGSEVKQMLDFFEKQYYCVGEFVEFEHYCRIGNREINADQEIEDLLNEGRLITLFAKIRAKISGSRINSSDMLKIQPALDAMNADAQKRYTNEELSRLCALSKDYFLKTFKRLMNITPQQYYISNIIDKGRYLLANTTYNISEISSLCGVEDSLYFSRLFKRRVGVSPREYRNE
jgi:AraC-like DNA-binding protein